MKHTIVNYKGFTIIQRIDVKISSSLIFREGVDINGLPVKCIAGDIFADGTNNAIEKAKTWIDNNA